MGHEGECRLFPLPLVAWEQFLWLDDRPEWPMIFTVELAFRGGARREFLEAAFREALDQHPLLSSRIELHHGVPVWMPFVPSQPVINWCDYTGDVAPPPLLPQDLRHGGGLHVHVADSPERTHIVCQFHHACCDGNGSRQFLIDVLIGYARRCGADIASGKLPPRDLQLLRHRGLFTTPVTHQPTDRPVTAWTKIVEAFHFHCLTPRPIRLPPGTRESQRNTQSEVKHLFSVDQTNRFRQLVRATPGKLNDVALALLFQTLADWNNGEGQGSPGRLRISMPTDLRNRRDDQLPATNRMSMAFLSRQAAACQDWNSLLPWVIAETSYFKQVQIGRDFLIGIDWMRRWPRLLRGLLQLPRCHATAVLTNLGTPTRRVQNWLPQQDGQPCFGNLVLEYITGTPPLRPGTHAGFSLSLASGRLAIALRGSRLLSPASTGKLLEAYVDRWNRWARDGQC